MYIWGGDSASTSAIMSPICSPCRMEALRWERRRTRVAGPVAAAVTCLGSLIVLAAGIMEPSVAHVLLLWDKVDGGNLQVLASALM